MTAENQRDMFEDEYNKPRLFDCVAGSYIGTFNIASAENNPINRISQYYSTHAEAQTALDAGTWQAPALDQ